MWLTGGISYDHFFCLSVVCSMFIENYFNQGNKIITSHWKKMVRKLQEMNTNKYCICRKKHRHLLNSSKIYSTYKTKRKLNEWIMTDINFWVFQIIVFFQSLLTFYIIESIKKNLQSANQQTSVKKTYSAQTIPRQVCRTHSSIHTRKQKLLISLIKPQNFLKVNLISNQHNFSQI